MAQVTVLQAGSSANEFRQFIDQVRDRLDMNVAEIKRNGVKSDSDQFTKWSFGSIEVTRQHRFGLHTLKATLS